MLAGVLFAIATNELGMNWDLPFLKFVDDMQFLESLKVSIACDDNLKVKNDILKTLPTLDLVEKFAESHCMKLNKNKTKCVLFDLCKTGVHAQISHPVSNEPIIFVKELKLLGFWINNELNHQRTVDEKCKSARRCLWSLVRLREAHFPMDKLVHIYILNIRSILEYSIVAILTSLTKKQLRVCFETRSW